METVNRIYQKHWRVISVLCVALKSSRDMMEALFRSSRPSKSTTEVNIASAREIETENLHSCLREIAVILSVSRETIRAILNTNHLGKKRCSAQ